MLYVDIEKKCPLYGMFFIFYALGQRFWYEEMGFVIDSDAKHCFSCRQSNRQTQQLKLNYQRLITLESRTPKETKELKTIAEQLYELGYIKDAAKVNNIK